jgi:hypothetical protein
MLPSAAVVPARARRAAGKGAPSLDLGGLDAVLERIRQARTLVLVGGVAVLVVIVGVWWFAGGS